MKTKAIIFAVMLGVALSASAQQKSLPSQMRSNFLPAPATQAEVQEDEIYNRGTAALSDEQWQKALEAFQEVRKLNGRRADAALYWKAYAENKMGNRPAATASIAELRKEFPKSTWNKDASALEVEMKQGTGRVARPESEDDDDIKLLAINSLMNSDEERAIPMLQKLLDSNQSAQFKERALFVLSQSDSPKAHQILDSVARGQSQPELQARAIRNLGINGTQQNRTTLAEIYKSSNDSKIKHEVLQSLGVAGDKDNLFALARTEKTPEMQDAVIQALAVAGADSQLRQLYKEAGTDVHAKERILNASIITGDKQLVDDVLKTETNPTLRRQAIRVLGINGGSTAQLVSMYENEKDKETKDAAIEALFVSGDAHSLVALAKKETDPGMRREIIEKLSVMGNREANDYLMELLNK